MNKLKMLLVDLFNNYLLNHCQYHFFVANFEFSLSEPFNKFAISCVSIIYMIVTEFCEKLKLFFSDF